MIVARRRGRCCRPRLTLSVVFRLERIRVARLLCPNPAFISGYYERKFTDARLRFHMNDVINCPSNDDVIVTVAIFVIVERRDDSVSRSSRDVIVFVIVVTWLFATA